MSARFFGKYALLQLIKSGGMGTVWRARDTSHAEVRRDVALKTILGHAADDPEFVKMFVDEAKITVQLTHANIAQVYELGVVEGTYYFAMEYVSGQDVKSLFERSVARGYPTPVPIACYIVSKVCEALDAAHRSVDKFGRPLQVVHRDVSPHNVLLSYEGEVKLIDFGIAHVASTQEDADVVKGKLAYMSPEQVRGRPLDGRSDIFSAGIVLHELLTGHRAFVGSDFTVLEKVRAADVVAPSKLNPRVPAELDAIVARALARDRERRYADAGEFGNALLRHAFPTGRNELSRFVQSTFSEALAVERRRLAESELVPIGPPPERAGTTVLVTAEPTPTTLRPGMELVSMSDEDRAFAVDAQPVTVRQYTAFLEATGRKSPASLMTAAVRNVDTPVLGVSHAGARAYAQWADKRLLTLWEWRRASQQLVAPEYQFGTRWEWTASDSPKGGYFVCGGAHRDRTEEGAHREHVSFELGPGPDVTFRCATDVD